MELDVTVQLHAIRWKTCLRPYCKTVRQMCHAALMETPLASTDCELTMSVVLADDAFIRELNHTYRGKNTPTNVLSFPDMDHLEHYILTHSKQQKTFALGDVVLALETIQQEASDQHKIFKHHVMHLLVHGTLHLLGYDHQNETQAKKMEQKEIKTLKKQNVENPYLS